MLYYLEMFNDEIMMLYLIVCLYYAITDRPVKASFFFTMGVGVKAGLLLIIPAFLGSVQLNYGTIKLITCIGVIVGM